MYTYSQKTIQLLHYETKKQNPTYRETKMRKVFDFPERTRVLNQTGFNKLEIKTDDESALQRHTKKFRGEKF